MITYKDLRTIRNIRQEDLNSLKAVINSNELFPSELLEDMTSDYFANVQTTDIWLTMEDEGKVIAVSYCAPERMAEGTYNLYLIAIHKEFQGNGIGSELMKYIEEYLLQSNNRILIVETSGLPEFGLTRRFYEKLNYQQVGIIPEFYQQGEDKVIFWKNLNS